MTVKSTKLTKAMRRVLERMEHCVVVYVEKVESPESSCWYWGDTGKKLSLDMVCIFVDLEELGFVTSSRITKRTPAGRKALKETGQ